MRTERSYVTMDQLLYVVQWDTGQTTKHYFGDLFVIGPFETLHAFEEALLAGVRTANLTVGPQGGFRHVVIELEFQGHSMLIEFEQAQRNIWKDVIRPVLERANVQVVETRLPKA